MSASHLDGIKEGAPEEIAQGGFPHPWRATILKQRPLILPRRRYVYPREAEEVERGALELLITPRPFGEISLVEPGGGEAFLATCALGFADPLAPTGIWSCPNPAQLCAVAGGYAYLIDTANPEHFEQIAYRPVLAVYALPAAGLLLFVGNQKIVAYNECGRAWESLRLSDEGLTNVSACGDQLTGAGWRLTGDYEIPFVLDLKTGRSVE